MRRRPEMKTTTWCLASRLSALFNELRLMNTRTHSLASHLYPTTYPFVAIARATSATHLSLLPYGWVSRGLGGGGLVGRVSGGGVRWGAGFLPALSVRPSMAVCFLSLAPELA
ncbi:hypothetical protein GUJ93_ZPchr0007g5263 [Zizania palustris]|uniref:Uncharacterized protein n=1 Tax=Zizania palustris TaxID=103762 RepID=A0A8J5T7G7_ZIZPA|nr:hypothetical protein GUJ93_ZPchr0007g5263 [Zizania palustris]